MGNKSRKEEIKEFKKTPGGTKKYIWMLGGATIDVIGTIGICVLINNAYRVHNMLSFYAILFVFLVIVVLGGELIGVYFGALEQFIYNKNQKKVLDINE